MSGANGISSNNTSIYNRGKMNAYKGSNIIGANADDLKKKQQLVVVNNIGNILNGSVQPNACGW